MSSVESCILTDRAVYLFHQRKNNAVRYTKIIMVLCILSSLYIWHVAHI